MILKRTILEQIESVLFQKKAIIILGPRQVGKTTLLREIQKKHDNCIYLNCDEPDVRENLKNKTSTELKNYFTSHKLILIDEAQRVPNIGVSIKLVVDNFSEIQIVATGSSSFDLANSIREPLTGRNYEFMLYPPSVLELEDQFGSIETKRLFEDMLIYGNYPIIRLENPKDKYLELSKIATDYVYKDILMLERIKYPEKLEKLLRALAHQIGNEVSYNELSSLCELSKDTVQEYVRILEQAFIIFKLEPYATNKRTSLKRQRKIYFWDLGIRNALIKDTRPSDIRNDMGALFENFFISEFKKQISYTNSPQSIYFWRDYGGQEIDLIIEKEGKIEALECKLSLEKENLSFGKNAPVALAKIVNRKNYLDFLH